ncbi:hypothetical protein C4K03_0302 [Pseudomonas synxantha]|uniref:Uncharacterized protein n=1 Tax=Pseudomonas synxantha TaxID=47883 RepID=A0A3G7TZP3_9PSED|nr:hypothetical protein C4K03_0302 [Pseudomonas synxantha]
MIFVMGEGTCPESPMATDSWHLTSSRCLQIRGDSVYEAKGYPSHERRVAAKSSFELKKP